MFKIQETSYKIQDAWLLSLSRVCISPTATFGWSWVADAPFKRGKSTRTL